MNNLKYVRLNKTNTYLIDDLKNDHTINEFIHISDHFVEYLLSSDEILYLYIYVNDTLAGALHIERKDGIGTFSIEIMQKYQRQGIALTVLNDLKDNKFGLDINQYKITIELNNESSLGLFKKAGFIHTGSEDNLLIFEWYMKDLYSISNELSEMINKNVMLVKNAFPHVVYEEYIVIPMLNNMIMLRFSNRDIQDLSLIELSSREDAIREIVAPDFLANFVGRDYKTYGLKINELENTLIQVEKSLKSIVYRNLPSYFDDIKNDLNRISKIYGEDLYFWELQIHERSIEVLFFSKVKEKKRVDNLTFSPIECNESYNGIIKAELHAIEEGVSLVEIMLRYQNDIN